MFQKSFLMMAVLSAVMTYAAKKPNVIVIVTDDHGYADFGAYGLSDDIRTPHLDRLAKNGALMTHGYVTAPQCVPSRAGIVTGRYQTRFGLEDNAYSPMDINETTIAERMRDAGYATGFVGKWHLDPTHESKEWMKEAWPEGVKQKRASPSAKLRAPYKPINRGFTDVYDGSMNSYSRNYDLDGNSIPLEQEMDSKTFRVDKQSQAALAFIKRHKDEPFFLHLAYFAPHVPLEVVKKHFDRFPGEMAERRRWALASIAAIDDGVGAIMESLRKYGIEEDTLIFYFADNGAPLKIHMKDDPFNKPGWDGSLNGPMVGEKGMISDGGVRVPYLVYWKGKIPAQIYEHPVISLDAGATALACAGVTTKPGEIDGVNILPYLAGNKSGDPHDALYWRFWGQSAIREGKWKLFVLQNGVRMLFDMESEQHENQNLIAEHPETADRLEKKLSVWSKAQRRSDFTSEYGRESRWFEHYFGVE